MHNRPVIPDLPPGLVARPLELTDAHAVFEVMAAQELADLGVVSIEAADIVADWQRPSFDVSSSTMIAWVTSTLTFEVCNNLARGNWQNPASGAVTLTAVGITASVSVTPYQWGRLRVTSSAASTFRATVNIHGEGGS